MEKTLSMGAFKELDEREVMETEGGFVISGTCLLVCGIITAASCCTAVGVLAVAGAQASVAQSKADEAERQYIATYGKAP